MRRALVAIGLAGVAAAAALVLYVRYAPRSVPAGQLPLRSLPAGDFTALRDEFNGAADRTRLLLLLSPT